jgi:parvulin-like peptidyl-prolyl isomerase
MNKRFFFGILLVLFFPVYSVRAEVVDKIVAVVNDEPITQSELDIYLAPIYHQYKSVYFGEDFQEKMNDARLKLLNQLIEDKLVLQEAKKLGVTVSDSEIDEKLNELKSHFKSDEEFQNLLSQQGLTLKQMRKRFEDQIAIRKLHQYEIRSKVVISPKDVEAFFDAHKDEFKLPERVKLSTIMLRKKQQNLVEGEKTASSSRDPQMKLAQEILQKLKKGESFEKLAKQYSEESHAAQGGDVGMVGRGDLIPEIEEAIFKLEKGGLSEVVESSVGFHIFRVEDKQPPKDRTLEEVREEIQGILYREKSRDRFEKWMNNLKNHAYISTR